MPVVIVLLVLIILAELFLLMLRCRREHPGWKLLRQYRYATGATTTSPIFRKTPWRPSAVPLNTATVLSWTSI